MKKIDKIAISLLSVILLGPIVYYTIVNFNNGFSKDLIELANFSTYYITFITLGNLFVFVYLSIKIHDYNISKDRENKLLQKSLNQPIISIHYDESKSNFYQIENIGNGPALNVLLFVRYSKDTINWDESYNCFTLKTFRNIELKLYGDIKAFGVVYNDILGNKYASYLIDNTLQVFDFNDDEFENTELFKLFKSKAKNHTNNLPNDSPPSV